METIWFCLLALMLTVYVILDGFDLGAGIVHLFAAKTEDERRQVLDSIGPFWDGNEVWLLAAGGTLFLAFPTLYASSFMGFYLPLMIVLWLLMGRGLSIELRNHLDSPFWRPLFDFGFAVSSSLLAIFLGAALGNVVRGVPLDSNQEFFLPLWTDFVPGRPEPGILDLYTVLAGLTAFAALTAHGALWVQYRTVTGTELQLRARKIARMAIWGTAALTAALTGFSFGLRPEFMQRFFANPAGLTFPVMAIAGLVGSAIWLNKGEELRAFLGSCAYLAGMLASVAFSLFPNVLPSSKDATQNLTIFNSAAGGTYGHEIALWWWIPGIALSGGYFFFLYRRFRGKTTMEAGQHSS
jgi:cytochrome d ubiquinol oxidase subunit II